MTVIKLSFALNLSVYMYVSVSRSISAGDQNVLKIDMITEFLCCFWGLNMNRKEISGEEQRLALMELDVLWGLG